jgi:hypothetical protein
MTQKKTEAAKALAKRIKEHNQAFAKASPAQRIVMVAKDVLLQLGKGNYEATGGTYFETEVTAAEADTPLHTLIANAPEACHVCAIGSVFASCVRLANVVTVELEQQTARKLMQLCKLRGVGELLNGGLRTDEGSTTHTLSLSWAEFGSYLKQFFPDSLLKLMENAFEQGDHGYDYYDADEEEKLIRIMKNLITNEGKAFTYYVPSEPIWEA